MVVRLEPMATTGFDSDYDAGKIFSPADKTPQIYSEMKGEFYSINAIPFPKNKTIIPLTLRLPETGTFKIRRSQLQGLGNAKVVLNDKSTGNSIDLLAYSEYSFSSPAGTISDRFSVTISTVVTGTVEKAAAASSLKVYASSGKVCVLPQGKEWEGVRGKVRIFDITGRVLLVGSEEWYNSGELKEYSPSGAGGLLIVEVTAGGKRYLEKVVLNGGL
jgi:hypothetical protein